MEKPTNEAPEKVKTNAAKEAGSTEGDAAVGQRAGDVLNFPEVDGRNGQPTTAETTTSAKGDAAVGQRARDVLSFPKAVEVPGRRGGRLGRTAAEAVTSEEIKDRVFDVAQ